HPPYFSVFSLLLASGGPRVTAHASFEDQRRVLTEEQHMRPDYRGTHNED
ncbi:hypothetical protein CLOP_g15366, partial [Closterium sp. NIES-67]